jgi:hypothetical protein
LSFSRIQVISINASNSKVKYYVPLYFWEASRSSINQQRVPWSAEVLLLKDWLKRRDSTVSRDNPMNRLDSLLFCRFLTAHNSDIDILPAVRTGYIKN